MKLKIQVLVFFLSLTLLSIAQVRTVGTIFNSDESLDGFTFYSPFSSESAFMVDNCGALVNQWDRGTRPGLAAYFLESGNMLRTYKVNPEGPFTSASNAGGLELVDWENNTVWSYELNTSTELSHHDAVQMPNGNFLMLTWELIFEDELIAMGRDPNQIAPQGFAWNERIIEVRPVGADDVEIVWEWRIRDHYIQDRDNTLSNFGDVAENAQLFDINLADINSSNSHADFDYNHFNAIDYNPELDQILISVRNSDEVWIIDHSTTTEEAAGHTGGNSGMGGDILYRWGNPSAYKAGPISEQVLFGQHGVHWLTNGPEAGNILIFNNGNGRPGTDFSTIEILEPPLMTDGNYTKNGIDPFGPLSPKWKYGDGAGENFNSPFLSNAQYLDNGNFLINVGSRGEIFEINPDREVVWEYVIPLFGDFPATQGQNVNNNATFRAYRFAKDFAGFNGLDTTPGSTIESDPNPLVCNEETNSIIEQGNQTDITIINLPSQIQIENPSNQEVSVQVFDVQGRLVSNFKFNGASHLLEKQDLSSGLYFVTAIIDVHNFVSQQVIVTK